MNDRIITHEEFMKFKRFYPNNHKESNLYIDNDKLLKFLHDEYSKKRKEVCEYLRQIKNESCVLPLYSISMEDEFKGYAMKYYKEYITLTKTLKYPYIPFETRKEMAIKLWDILSFFRDNGIGYFDLHTDNVIVNDDYDLKLVDMDSSCIKDIHGDLKYATAYLASQKKASILSLIILFNLYGDSFGYFKRKAADVIYLASDKQKELICHGTNQEYEPFDGHESILSFDEEFVSDINHKLKLVRY